MLKFAPCQKFYEHEKKNDYKWLQKLREQWKWNAKWPCYGKIGGQMIEKECPRVLKWMKYGKFWSRKMKKKLKKDKKIKTYHMVKRETTKILSNMSPLSQRPL